MIVLGIDPGYERLGIALIEKNARTKEKLLYSECFETKRSLSHPERLLAIKLHCQEIISTYKPTVLGIETLFFSANQKTAFPVSEARGVILLTAAENSLSIYEFSPPEIKMSVTGYGKADKKQIIDMVRMLLGLKKTRARDDEFDAIAVALTTLVHL